jgi:hypothetical protein
MKQIDLEECEMILWTSDVRMIWATLGPHLLLALIAIGPSELHGQRAAQDDTSGREIPMPAAIQRAHAAGTRDSTGRPGPYYWQLHTEYDLYAHLNVMSSTVRGRGTIVIHNTSPTPLRTVQLRLDQNHFRRGTPPQRNVPTHTDGICITRLIVDGQVATIAPAEDLAPPYLSGTRTTSEQITLAQSVAPNSSIQLEVEWHFEVPLDNEGGALRQGRWGNDVYQVALWYPRVAMFDDLNGWDTSTYDGSAEFYNPYGRFNVRLDVPAGWLVGASGVLQNPEEVLTPRTRQRLASVLETDSIVTVVSWDERGPGKATLSGDRLIWHFVADSVRDFAWGASPRYVWKSIRVDVPNREAIPAHMLYTAANASTYENAGAILRHDLAFNSSLMMPYAYPQHTLLDGPEGGMEYPMLTMSDGTRLSHELWHQWFPMMVGSNETWYSFMDEGFATLLAGVSESARLGSTWDCRPVGSGREMEAPLIWADDRDPPSVLAALYGYGRPARMFCALGERIGHEALLQALSNYGKAWRFKHPSPWDFMFFMNQASGHDLGGFWYRWIFSTK